MATHLPNNDLIDEYACGATAPGMSLLMSAHLTTAPESRATAEDVEAMGGALLHTQASEQMSEDALDDALAQLDLPEVDVDAAPFDALPLPSVVADILGMGFDEIPWKFVLPGVSSYDLDGFEGEHVSLLRAKPGVRLPRHTHDGVEATLVLQGQLSDGGVVYAKGDVALNDDDDDHQPQIIGDEVCICLVVRQGDLRFTGMFSRVLNYIGE